MRRQANHFTDRDMASIAWIDNEAARISSSKGNSDSPTLAAMARMIQAAEQSMPSLMWLEMVSSFSNPSDDPSRGRVHEAALGEDQLLTRGKMPKLVATTATHSYEGSKGGQWKSQSMQSIAPTGITQRAHKTRNPEFFPPAVDRKKKGERARNHSSLHVHKSTRNQRDVSLFNPFLSQLRSREILFRF